MIPTINSLSPSRRVNFQSNSRYLNNSVAILGYNSANQVGSLRSVCKEILSKISSDKSLLALIGLSLAGIKLTEEAITFSTKENDGIRLSLPRGIDGDLFKIQVLKDEKTINSLTFDTFNKIIKNYDDDSEEFIKEKEINADAMDKWIEGVFNSVDEPIFQLRMFVKNNSENVQEKVEKAKLKTKKTSKKETKTDDKKEIFIPAASQLMDFSYLELIRKQGSLQKEAVIEEETETIKRIKRLQARDDRRKQQYLSRKAEVKAEKNKKEEVSKKVKKAKTTPTRKKVDRQVPANLESSGVLNSDLKEKVSKIMELQQSIAEFLKNKSAPQAVRIRTAYGDVQTYANRLIMGPITIMNPKRTYYEGHNILNLHDSRTDEAVNIDDLERVISTKINWKLKGVMPILRYYTPEELEKLTNDASFKNLINETLVRLQDFKSFLDKKGWIECKAKAVNADEAGVISNDMQKKLKTIDERARRIHSLLKDLSSFSTAKVFDESCGVEFVRSSNRLEFINPLNDGYNIIFNNSDSRYGKLSLVIKHNGNDELAEAFAVTPEGRLVENIVRDKGVNRLLSTHQNIQVKFYTSDEIKNADYEKRLGALLDVLDKKTLEYEQYLIVKREKSGVKLKPRKIDLSVVQEFLLNTANNIQSKAAEIEEKTGIKLAITSLAEDLRKSFEEFINQQAK